MSFPRSSGHKALRLGRVSIPGQVYLLTTVTRRRQHLLVEPACAQEASRVIHAAQIWADSQLLAWVLMPDHWHGLLLLGEEPLSPVMHRFKGNVSRALRDSGTCQSSSWERGFHDHALRKEEHRKSASDYIIANPLRAGLVANLFDYPYWNTAWLSTLQEPARGRCSWFDVKGIARERAPTKVCQLPDFHGTERPRFDQVRRMLSCTGLAEFSSAARRGLHGAVSAVGPSRPRVSPAPPHRA